MLKVTNSEASNYATFSIPLLLPPYRALSGASQVHSKSHFSYSGGPKRVNPSKSRGRSFSCSQCFRKQKIFVSVRLALSLCNFRALRRCMAVSCVVGHHQAPRLLLRCVVEIRFSVAVLMLGGPVIVIRKVECLPKKL
jgi:hypothetical protein